MISYGRMMYVVDQELGKALGYPEYGPDMGAEPGDVCTGDHTPESLAGEAAGKIRELTATVEASLDLVSRAVRLRMYGEEEGGCETWTQFERDARAWIDSPAVRKVRGL